MKEDSATMRPADDSVVRGRPIGSSRHVVLACIGLLSWLADEWPTLLEQRLQRDKRVTKPSATRVPPQRAGTALVQTHDAQGSAQRSRGGWSSHQDFEALQQRLIELEREIDRLVARRTTKP